MIDRDPAEVGTITHDDKTVATTPADVAREARDRVSALEPAELRALVHLVRGCSLIRVAGEMNIGLEEAVLLKARLMRKLNATHTADIIRLGIYARVDEENGPN